MAKKQPGLLLFYEDLEVLSALSDAQLGALIRALAFDTEVPEDLGIILAMMRRKKARYEEHYRQICEQNRMKNVLRWHPDSPEATEYRRMRGNPTESYGILLDTDESNGIQQDTTASQWFPSKTKTITETETTPDINKNKDDARVREALFEEIKDGYCHGSGTLERKLRKLIDKHGEQKIREIISAGASTIWDLDSRLEHGEATDESAD